MSLKLCAISIIAQELVLEPIEERARVQHHSSLSVSTHSPEATCFCRDLLELQKRSCLFHKSLELEDLTVKNEIWFSSLQPVKVLLALPC